MCTYVCVCVCVCVGGGLNRFGVLSKEFTLGHTFPPLCNKISPLKYDPKVLYLASGLPAPRAEFKVQQAPLLDWPLRKPVCVTNNDSGKGEGIGRDMNS